MNIPTPTLTLTIDRNPRSLSLEATEADIEQYRIRLEDEIGRAFPARQVRVLTGPVLGYECTGESLTYEQDKAISRLWLETAAEVVRKERALTVEQFAAARQPDPYGGNLPYPRDWLLTECLDRGPDHPYRYHVIGRHLESGEPICWSVPTLSWRYELRAA